MIIANLATYPPRLACAEDVIRKIAPQVDLINVVLNQCDQTLSTLSNLSNVRQILPAEDTKDTGKFFPEVDNAEWVILLDDDLVYPANYVEDTIVKISGLKQGRVLAGYHGVTYRRPKFSLEPRELRTWLMHGSRVHMWRDVAHFEEALAETIYVDQVGSGTAAIRGADMPPYAYMRGSQRFADVRLARWCYEEGLDVVCLPRPPGFLGSVSFDESIWESFTKRSPRHVREEILTFAYRRQNVHQMQRPCPGSV